jgi:hypothetical protein
MAAQVETQLTDSRPFIREQGIKALRTAITTGVADLQMLSVLCTSLIQAQDSDKLLGGLLLGRELVSLGQAKPLETELVATALRLMTHNELRIRQNSGELLEALAKNSLELTQQCVGGALAVLQASNSEVPILESCSRTIEALAAASPTEMSEIQAERLMEVVKAGSLSKSLRETAQLLLADICRKAPSSLLESLDLLPTLSQGLEDSWGPVRMQALHAVNTYFSRVHRVPEAHEAALLPRICLNRHYPAEGLRTLALETWRAYVGESGRNRLVTHLPTVCRYYESQSRAESAASREAACHCISELATKIEPLAHEPLSAFLPGLLSVALECTEDADWGVQDAACIACAELVCVFPTEAADQLQKATAMWLKRLSDHRLSMREHSAYGLIKAAGKLEIDLWSQIDEYIRINGAKAREQSAYERTHSPRSQSSTDVYPWELSDGCVFLVKELATAKADLAAVHLPLLADLARVKDFSASVFLKDSVWKSLPGIAAGLGKRRFKDYLEGFIEELVSDTESNRNIGQVENLRVVARDCLQALSRFLGPTIFRGRVELHSPSLLRALDAALQPKH